MINQVEFEGYLTRGWEYREQKYMRLANHRPGENGETLSDYVTVQIDPSLDFDPQRVKTGRLLRVTGRIVGRDIVEPLKLVVSKSHDGVELPGELSNLVIRRPTVQILATQVKLLNGAKPSKKKSKASPRAPRLSLRQAQRSGSGQAFSRAAVPAGKPVEMLPLPPVSIEPGQDLAELVPAQ